MALIYDGSTCAICDGKLDRPYTATSGVAFEPPHPLYKYCDAPLHFDCLESWPHRVEFPEGYFNLPIGVAGKYGYRLISRTSEWMLLAWHIADEPFARDIEIRMRTWPFRLGPRWANWDNFVVGDFRIGKVGAALTAVEQVMSEITAIAPDLKALNRQYAIARTMELHGN